MSVAARTPNISVCKISSSDFRAAALTTPADKGHVQLQCLDDCFAETTLADIEGITFPGEFGKQPSRRVECLENGFAFYP